MCFRDDFVIVGFKEPPDATVMTVSRRVGMFDSGETPFVIPIAIFFIRLLCRFWGLREFEAAGLSVNESDSIGTVTAESMIKI